MGVSRGHCSGVWRPSVPPKGPSFSYRAQGLTCTEQNLSQPARDRSLPLVDHLVKWTDLGLKMQARIFQGRAGAGCLGVVQPPLFRGKGLVVLDVCPRTCNSRHLMRPGSRPSGHPTQQFSKMAAALKDGFAAAACVRGRHFLSCGSVFQADNRGGARVGGVPGELPGGLARALFLESSRILRLSLY